MKVINILVERLEEQSRKLSVENEGVPVSKEDTISLQMYLLRPERFSKETKKLSENN